MESRNVIFIETPSRLFPPPLEETSQQVNPPSNGMDDHNYIADDDFLRDLCNYTSVLEPLLGASADHIAVGGLSDNLPVAATLGADQRDHEEGHTGRRNCRTTSRRGDARGRAYGRSFAGGCSRTTGAGGVTGASLETPLAGSRPLQRRGHSRLEATLAVTRAALLHNRL